MMSVGGGSVAMDSHMQQAAASTSLPQQQQQTTAVAGAAMAAGSTADAEPKTNKDKYRLMKRRFKLLVYENECYQEELRNLQRKLLKLSRDKNFLLDRLQQYEKLSDSSDDSDASQSVVTEKKPPKRRARPAPRRRVQQQQPAQPQQPPPPPTQMPPSMQQHNTNTKIETSIIAGGASGSSDVLPPVQQQQQQQQQNGHASHSHSNDSFSNGLDHVIKSEPELNKLKLHNSTTVFTLNENAPEHEINFLDDD